MAKGIESIVEIWSNEYTDKREKFPSIRKAIAYARNKSCRISGVDHHFIGVTRVDRKGYIYMTN